jgi:ankyrin repeat protein
MTLSFLCIVQIESSLLMVAMEQGASMHLVELLLAFGADPNAKNEVSFQL